MRTKPNDSPLSMMMFLSSIPFAFPSLTQSPETASAIKNHPQQQPDTKPGPGISPADTSRK